MKMIKYFIAVFLGVLLFASCQKEYSLETGKTGGIAVGTLKDAFGNCQPISVNGVYQTNTALTDSNYILVQVDITTPGVYVIGTDTKNGMSFRDSGYIGATGLQTIKLKGSGIPGTTDLTEFTVSFGGSFCLFTLTPTQGTGGGPQATYTLVAGTGGACSNYSVQGTYAAGTPLSTSNTVTLQVNVTTVGNYSITTTTQNGMTFFRSGTFTTTGNQSVVLQGSGTPTAAGNTTIPVTAGSSNCSFAVTVGPGSGGGGTDPNDADSAWSFTQGGTVYHGPFDFVFDSTLGGNRSSVWLQGSTSATGDSILLFVLIMPSNTIQTGTFNSNPANPANFNAGYYFYDFRNQNAEPITLDSSLVGTAGSNMQFIVTSYNPTTRVITGTFSGTAKTPTGATRTITDGKFEGKLE